MLISLAGPSRRVTLGADLVEQVVEAARIGGRTSHSAVGRIHRHGDNGSQQKRRGLSRAAVCWMAVPMRGRWCDGVSAGRRGSKLTLLQNSRAVQPERCSAAEGP